MIPTTPYSPHPLLPMPPMPDDFIKSINKELSSKGKAGNLKLSSTVGSFKGGFILEKNGIEINNTFEALVESMKEEMQLEVAKALFN